MNWKSTALVSGAGLLATWLAQPPVSVPGVAPQPVTATARAAATPADTNAAPDIQGLAEHLARRNAERATYDRPARNLFRFDTARAPQPPARIAPPVTIAPAITEAPSPVVHLAGIAVDLVDGVEVRTAILSTPNGVVLARDGEPVAPGITLSRIDAEGVTLVHADGVTQTLPLGR